MILPGPRFEVYICDPRHPAAYRGALLVDLHTDRAAVLQPRPQAGLSWGAWGFSVHDTRMAPIVAALGYHPRVMRAWWRDPAYPARRFTLVALDDLLAV